MAKFDEQAALAAGATPFAVSLYKAQNFLAMAPEMPGQHPGKSGGGRSLDRKII